MGAKRPKSLVTLKTFISIEFLSLFGGCSDVTLIKETCYPLSFTLDCLYLSLYSVTLLTDSQVQVRL